MLMTVGGVGNGGELGGGGTVAKKAERWNEAESRCARQLEGAWCREGVKGANGPASGLSRVSVTSDGRRRLATPCVRSTDWRPCP